MEWIGYDGVPVLESKLIAPELPAAAMFTERLRRLEIAVRRCTLIVAPAGYGKTTAALLALDRLGAQVCWYRLEKEDARFQVFAAHLVGSLFQKADGAGALQSAGFLSRAAQDIELFDPALCHDAWAHFGRDPARAPVCLVLDNFHHAANQSRIGRCVRYMLSNMPPCVRVVLISREPTGLEEDRALAGDFAAVGADALRFTQEETRAYCRQRLGGAARDRDFRRIHELSEGWVAGIAMIILAFETSGGAHLERFLDNGLAGGELFDCLTSRTLRQEDGEALRTLLKLSLLEDFRAEEAAGMFGIADAEERIAALAARNLFLTRTMTGGGAVYRFHSLYRNALAALAQDAFGSAGLRALNGHVARCYRAAGRYDRAVRHHLAAGETGEAADVVGENAGRMIEEGAVEAVKTLVAHFPEAYRENHPHLLMYDGVANKRQDFGRAIRCLERARTLFESAGNHAMRMQACLHLMMTSVYQNRLDIVIRVARELQSIPGAGEDALCRRALNLLSLSGATLSENFREGEALFSALRGDELNREERCGTYLYGCALRHRQGDLDGALKLLEQLFSSPLVGLDMYWRSFALSLRSRVHLLRGEFREAEERARELLELGERHAHPYSSANGKYYLAQLKYLAHDPQAAVRFLCGARRDYLSFENGARAGLCRLHHYLWLSGTGDAASPAQILDAYDALAALHPVQGDDDLAASLAGAALRECGECAQAEKLLLHSLDRSEAKGAAQSAAGTALHLSKLYFDIGNPEKGLAYLKRALLSCAENGYTVVYDLHFPTLVALCARAAGAGIQAAHVQAIVRKYFGSELPALGSMKSAKAFLRRFAQGLQAPQKDIEARLFGGLRITAGASSIDEGSFKTRKAAGIVKYLLLNRNRHCSRERLAGIFWPDTEKKAALNSLRVAICEIRKVLNSAGISFEDATPLILESRRGFYIPKKTCKTDTDAFSALFESLKAADQHSERAALFQLLDLYGEGLLPTDVYDDYTAVDREHFQAMYLEAAHRAAALLISERDWEGAEAVLLGIIKLDPISKSAHAALIRLYRSTGRHHMADAVSERFKQRYAKEVLERPGTADA